MSDTNVRQRLVVLTIDTILAVIRDYAGGNIPADAQAVSLKVNPQQAGKFMLVADSEEWEAGQPPLMLHFDIRRYYGVGK